ncbi:MAG: PDC sensor domain-containing protein [Candidatus Omnitrophota bacterium]
MRNIVGITVAGVLVFASASSAWAQDEKVSKNITRIAEKEIVALAGESVVVDAVKDANREAVKSLDEIMKLDKRWRATEGVDEWIGGFMNNPCADYLKKVQRSAKKGAQDLYSEMFVMDKQGNIVAETNKTSDYWQGDEDKFKKSFADGEGSIFIDEPSFDESTQTYLVQVSVPILDPDTEKAIGAMTVGINLDVLGE